MCKSATALPLSFTYGELCLKSARYGELLHVNRLLAVKTPSGSATADADLDGISDTLTGRGEQARETMAAIAAAGIDLDDVFAVLEREGVEKFVDSWQELLDSIDGRLREIRG